MLSTFGLISAGKGIEVAIAALPAIVAKHPDVLYLVAGQTHPEVVKNEGERYRLALERLVRDLDLERHVHFLDRFFTVEELAFLLSSTDLYLTPYRSQGADRLRGADLRRRRRLPGRVHAVLLRRGPARLRRRGAGAVRGLRGAGHGRRCDLLDDPAKLAAARAEARRVGAGLTWPTVGAADPGCAGRGRTRWARWTGSRRSRRPRARPGSGPTTCSPWSTTSASSQHADGVVPNRASGYCVDDVARLVIVALGLDRESGDAHLHPDGGAGPGVPAPRVGSGGPRHAQHDVLRPAMARRPARGRPRRACGLGAGRGHRRAAAAGRGRAEPAAARGHGARRWRPESLRGVAFAVLGPGPARPGCACPSRCRSCCARWPTGSPGGTPRPATDEWRWFEDDLDLRQRPPARRR